MKKKETQRQHWTSEEIQTAIGKALETEPAGPNKDYWMTDLTVDDIKAKYRTTKFKPSPLTVTLVRECCGEKFVHLLANKMKARSLKDWRCLEPTCRLKTLVMPFGKFEGQTLPWIYEQERSYLAWFHECVDDYEDIKALIRGLDGIETHLAAFRQKRQQQPAPLGPPVPPNELEEELRHTRESLQTTIEEMQTAQEELRATNEELQSNNEELQSTNEELNSSKEELQSLNEEMQTVNAELQTKMEELSQSNSDMKNLLNGIVIATIFLDNNLGVKRFTPEADRIVHLVAGDVGRPLSHFATNLKYDRLVEDAKEVLGRLVSKEAQVEAKDGHWYNMRILPYRSADNAIDGVVMTFADITAMKQFEESSQTAHEYAENIIATIREPLVVLDGELRIVSASQSFYETFQVTPAETERRLLYEVGHKQWDIPSLRQLLGDILAEGTPFRDFRVEHDFPGIGQRVLMLNARRMAGKDRL